MVQQVNDATNVYSWWELSRQSGCQSQRMQEISLAVYFIWHIWKERGWRIFQSKEATATGVAALVRADIELLSLAKPVM
jgi:hypothetical protein